MIIVTLVCLALGLAPTAEQLIRQGHQARACRERSYCAGTTAAEGVPPTERFDGSSTGEQLVAISVERLHKTTA